MRKIILTLTFVMLFTMNAFAYTWVHNGDQWNVVDKETGEVCKNFLFDTGDGVYYLDENGNMVTGWWKNVNTTKVYFFSNDINNDYGAMLFGLHMIDGYQRYFGEDGSLMTSDAQGEYKNVYGEYWADSQGMLYYCNEVLRDTSINKSEFYTDPAYYTNVELNNAFLANIDNVYQPIDKIRKDGKIDKAPVNNDRDLDKQKSGSSKTSASRTTGGTNYTVDATGHVHMEETGTTEVSSTEKYGPMKSNK